jgi:hypothetical protein
MRCIDRRRMCTVPRRVEGPRVATWSGRDQRTAVTATIVHYTDQEAPRNEYPLRIVSPPRPGRCCDSQMQAIGDVQDDGTAVFQYRGCPQCGFTVRRVLAQRPDPVLAAELRVLLERAFMRNLGAELWAA